MPLKMLVDSYERAIKPIRWLTAGQRNTVKITSINALFVSSFISIFQGFKFTIMNFIYILISRILMLIMALMAHRHGAKASLSD